MAFALVMAGLVRPAGPKPLRRGEGPAIHVLLCRDQSQDLYARTTPGMTSFTAGGIGIAVHGGALSRKGLTSLSMSRKA
jgi:hypothetical protein